MLSRHAVTNRNAMISGVKFTDKVAANWQKLAKIGKKEVDRKTGRTDSPI